MKLIAAYLLFIASIKRGWICRHYESRELCGNPGILKYLALAVNHFALANSKDFDKVHR